MRSVQVDLHMHTVASDGTQRPKELLNEVIEKDIKIFAITDHDSVDSIDEMHRLVADTERIFIPGVEISTSYKGKEIHLLTYHLKTDNKVLNDILSANQEVRELFNQKIIQHVATLKPNVSLEDYLVYKRDPSWGGWKAENYLRDIGAIHHLGDLFQMLRSMDDVMTFEAPESIVPKLKAEGAVIVLAHPPAYYGGDPLPKDMLDHFVEVGIDGIECFSPYYKEEDESIYYTDYCVKKGLMISCGSDYHGDFIQTRHMGHPEKTLKDLSIDPLLK